MKVRTIARNTFGSFLDNRVIHLFYAPFVCIVLYGIYFMLLVKSATTASNAQQMQGRMLDAVAEGMSLVSAFGSLLAAWVAADVVASEMKSGTILAVMARPLRRWQFLAGKYLGVLMLMSVYILGMFGATFLLTWLVGQTFHAPWWVLLVYPLVRYAVWAAISMFLVTFLPPVVVMGVFAILATLIRTFGSSTSIEPSKIPAWVSAPVHLILPLTNVLSEDRFIIMTQASLKGYPLTRHMTALAYGLDYALVWFLLAVVVFQRRSLSSD